MGGELREVETFFFIFRGVNINIIIEINILIIFILALSGVRLTVVNCTFYMNCSFSNAIPCLDTLKFFNTAVFVSCIPNST